MARRISDSVERGVALETVAAMISRGEYKDMLKHPTRRNQSIFILEIARYTWVEPFVVEEDRESIFTVRAETTTSTADNLTCQQVKEGYRSLATNRTMRALEEPMSAFRSASSSRKSIPRS